MDRASNNSPYSSPEDFLAAWTLNRGGLRRFFEDVALPPLDDRAQEQAGEAAAAAAVAEAFDLDLHDYNQGIDTVRGAWEAAGAAHITDPAPGVTPDVGAAAFFDVDNTLIQGASIIVFAMGLAKRRYFSLSEILPVAYKQLKFRITGSENSADVAEGRRQALEFIKGRRVDELTALCEEIVDDNVSEKIWPGTRRAAEEHLADGHQVWLVSATPVHLAQIMAKRLGFTGALGTVAEVKDGRFTGRLVGDILHGPGKAKAVAALATVEGLDLKRCTAYSDSFNDVPMLSMVGAAVAINPDRKLRKAAEKRGWEVRDFRSLRKAIRVFGLPTLVTAAFTWGGWTWIKK